MLSSALLCSPDNDGEYLSLDVYIYIALFRYTRFIFATNCHATGLMTDTEWYMYCDWHSFLSQTLPLRFDAIVYLRTDPKVLASCTGIFFTDCEDVHFHMCTF